MPNATEEIRECYRHAVECAWQVAAETDPQVRQQLLARSHAISGSEVPALLAILRASSLLNNLAAEPVQPRNRELCHGHECCSHSGKAGGLYEPAADHWAFW